MGSKSIIILALIVVMALVGTNIYTGLRLRKYKDKIKSPPLIERIYTNVAKEVDFQNPIVFTGNSMVHRMDWNYIFRQVSLDSVQVPIIINQVLSGKSFPIQPKT